MPKLLVATIVILYWVDATRPVILADVAALLIPVNITVEPLAGTAVAAYDVIATLCPSTGGVNEKLMEVVVLDTNVRVVGGVNNVCILTEPVMAELPAELLEIMFTL